MSETYVPTDELIHRRVYSQCWRENRFCQCYDL